MGAGEATLRKFQADYLDDSLTKFEATLELWKRIGDRPRLIDAFNHVGFVLHFQGKMKASVDAYQQAPDLARAERDDSGAVMALFGLAWHSPAMTPLNTRRPRNRPARRSNFPRQSLVRVGNRTR